VVEAAKAAGVENRKANVMNPKESSKTLSITLLGSCPAPIAE
jgi:hypothetical protein